MASSVFWKTLRTFNYNRCIPCNFNLLFRNRQMSQVEVTKKFVRFNSNNFSDMIVDEPTKPKRKKTVPIPKITLLYDNNDMTVVTLEEAEKLAKRRDLKLVKVVDLDTRSERPVYKLMKMQDFLKEEAKAKAEAKEKKEKAMKEDKTMAISSKISRHDLDVKIKSMHRMLKKRHGVRVLISVDGNPEKTKEIGDYIIENCSEIAKLVTRSDTGVHLKITIRPILEKILQEKSQQKDAEKEMDNEEDVIQ